MTDAASDFELIEMVFDAIGRDVAEVVSNGTAAGLGVVPQQIDDLVTNAWGGIAAGL